MALVLETGSGIPGANSYVSLTEAADLLSEVNITAEWTALPELRREALLVRATSLIDSEFRFRGELLKKSQGLAFPRKNLFTRDDREVLGIPRTVREATAELAFSLSKADVISDPGAANVEEVKVGPIDIKLSDSVRQKKLIPESIKQKLSLYGSHFLAVRRTRRLAG